MIFRSLGRSGLKVSAIGLGTNAFGGRATREASIAIVRRALDLGITLIDTANIYTGGHSEAIIGEALRGRRQEAVLATKAGMKTGEGPNDRGSSRHHLMREVEASLKRLGTDYIDLYQIHEFDPETPLEETLRALDDMVRAGKVRYIGCSNYAAWQVAKAQGIADRHHLTPFVSVQPSYSLADRAPERELVPCCLDLGLGIIAYFPLAGGILTGKYRAGQAPPEGSRARTQPRFADRMNEGNLALAATLTEMARELGCTPSQLALAWLIRQAAVAGAIAGATGVGQLEENARAAEVEVPADVMARLDEASRPFR